MQLWVSCECITLGLSLFMNRVYVGVEVSLSTLSSHSAQWGVVTDCGCIWIQVCSWVSEDKKVGSLHLSRWVSLSVSLSPWVLWVCMYI